ncbi:putative C-_U-editing enzyme APOBEC-4 [Rhynchocyon petersi]
MEPSFEEYLANHGTIVKPYSWLRFSLDCSNCPYHIRTGEEARVPYTEFYHTFGFPYGPINPQTKHLIFYELKTSSGSLVQKGHASSCTGNQIHPESMLFETKAYLDSALYNNSSIRHIILYSNNSPCNEASHCCISKMYNFLMMYPDVTLSIYFSQLYHTETDFPASAWNREALRSLASLWPQVTLSPISGGMWHSLLSNFVRGPSGSTMFQPILPGRALADRHNAYEIQVIAGVKPYFNDVLLQTKYIPNIRVQSEGYPLNNVFPGQSLHGTSGQIQTNLTPDPRIPVIFVLVPYRNLPPIQMDPASYKPRNVVRHLNMPQMSFQETEDLKSPPIGRPVEITEQLPNNKEASPGQPDLTRDSNDFSAAVATAAKAKATRPRPRSAFCPPSHPAPACAPDPAPFLQRFGACVLGPARSRKRERAHSQGGRRRRRRLERSVNLRRKERDQRAGSEPPEPPLPATPQSGRGKWRR